MFWLAAGILGAVVVAVLVRPLLTSRDRAGNDAEADVLVYRDQLAEVETDLARGVLTEADALAIRTEVSRRLLAAADRAAVGAQAGRAGGSRLVAAAVAVVVAIGGLGLYTWLGAPGYPDQPLAERLADNAQRYAQRPGQEEVEKMLDDAGTAPEGRVQVDPRQAELLDQLREVLKERGEDLRGHQLLADNLARLGQWRPAAAAQRDILRIKGEAASATDYVDLAEFQILAVNGYVSPEAEAALKAALTRDPRDPRARYYSGLSALQAGRADLAYELWMRLLSESGPDAPWVPAINSQIRDVALAAGRPVPETAAASGPSAADIEAAGDMSPEERQEMIRGMVARLSDRLATEGGPAEDWARLIRAYGVLGERAQANRVWTEAQEVFASSPADLSVLRQAARDAEVAQ